METCCNKEIKRNSECKPQLRVTGGWAHDAMGSPSPSPCFKFRIKFFESTCGLSVVRVCGRGSSPVDSDAARGFSGLKTVLLGFAPHRHVPVAFEPSPPHGPRDI
jgi:hypothetical protein